MRQLLLLLTCLSIVLSVGGGSIAHAMEPVICVDAGSPAAAGHSKGDGDEVPADADKGYPHHHVGCHGHQMAAPAEISAANEGAISHDRIAIGQSPALATAATDPGLRPPQA